MPVFHWLGRRKNQDAPYFQTILRIARATRYEHVSIRRLPINIDRLPMKDKSNSMDRDLLCYWKKQVGVSTCICGSTIGLKDSSLLTMERVYYHALLFYFLLKSVRNNNSFY